MSVPASYGVAAQVAPMFDKLEAGQMGRMAVVGDSIAFRPAWHSHLRAEFGTEFGFAGYGYRGVNIDFKWLNFQGVLETRVAFGGASTNIVKAKGSGKRDPTWGIYTPDGIFTRLRSDGAVTLTIPSGLTVKLHYLRQPGGGDLQVYKNGVLIQTIDTDGSIGNMIVSLASGTKYKLMSADSSWVQVNALETTKAAGFCLDRIGRGENNPANYNTGDTASTAAALTAMGVDLFMIETDRYTPNQTQVSFIADMKSYIAFIRAACPNAGVVLVSKHNSINHRADVADTLYQIAQDVGCGFIDHYYVKTYEENLALGYLATDGAHLSDTGGAFFAQYDADIMRATR